MFHIFRFPFSRKISLVQECWKNTKLSRYCQLLSASPSESKAEEPRFVSFALFPFLVILFNPLFPLHFLLSSPLAVMFRSTVDMRNSNTDVLTTDCTATSCALYSINFFFQLSLSDCCSYPWSAFLFEQKLVGWIQNALCKTMAGVARIWSLSLCRSIPRLKERGNCF